MKKLLAVFALSLAALTSLADNQWLYIVGFRIGDGEIMANDDHRIVATNNNAETKYDEIGITNSRLSSNAYFTVSVPAGQQVARWIAYNVNPTNRPPAQTNQFAEAVTEYVWSYNSNDTSTKYIVVDYDYITYRLNYNGDGDGGSMPYESHCYTNVFQLSSNAFSKTGYTFECWTNEVGTTFEDGASVDGSSFDVTYTNKTANLYAKWSPNVYTVTLDPCGGGMVPESVSATYDADWPELPSPTRDGYRFAGWFTAASGGTEINTNAHYVVAADSTNYAHWVEQVTATFNDGHTGETLKVETLDKGGTPTPPEAPKHDGYYPTGWVPALGPISENFTFTIEYAQYTYIVVFHADNGTGATHTQQFTYNAAEEPLNSVASMEGFSLAGYNFQNWTNSTGTVYDDGANVSNLAQSGEYHLYAVWRSIDYTIAFDGNGADNADAMADDVMTVEGALAKALVPNKFEKVGYGFGGWATNETDAVALSVAYTNCADVVGTNLWKSAGETNVFYAVWLANSYTVVFDRNGGTGSMADQEFTYGQAQALEKCCFTSSLEFKGWATNQTGEVVFADLATVSNLTAEVNGIVRLYAVWDNGELSNAMHCNNLVWEQVLIGTALWEVANEGYDSSGSSVSTMVTIDGDKYQSYTLKPQDSSAGKGSLSFLYMTSGADEGGCWLTFKNGQDENRINGSLEWVQYGPVAVDNIAEVALYFNMDQLYSQDTSYKVWIDQMTWIPDGSEPPEDSRTISFSQQNALVNGVETNETCYSSEGGTFVEIGHASPRVSFAAEFAPFDGVVFDGWDLTLGETTCSLADNPLVLDGNSSCFQETTNATCDIRAKYKWLEYRIDYNANGGYGTVTPDPSSYIYTNEVELASASPSPGYSLVGWATNETGEAVFEPGQVVTGVDIGATTGGVVALYANWTQNVYTVTFCYTNSEGVAASTVRSVLGTEDAQPPDPSEYDSWAGHSFVGWDVCYSNVVVDLTVNALYEEDHGGGGGGESTYYVVTFDANGGECGEHVRNVNCGEAVGELPEAVRDNYTFGGWFTSDDAEVTATTVPDTNVTYYAKWNFDGLVVTGSNMVFEVKEVVSLAFDECFLVETSSELKSITVSGLPSGVKFDEKTGSFSGAPSKAGLYYVTSVVKNVSGYQYSSTAVWNVGDTPSADNDNGGIGEDILAQLDGLVTGYVYELVGFTNATAVSGLPAGLKFAKATGVIAGTPTKPGKATVTLTGVNKAKSVKTVIVVDGGMHELTLATAPVNSTNATGKATGSGVYAVGKNVTIRATAAKGSVFAGWYDAEGNPLVGSIDFRTASFSYVMGGGKTGLTAKFATEEEDKDSLRFVNMTNVTATADGALVLDLGACVTSLSLPKLTVTGLPSGLKYDAKSMKVSGAAKKPGSYTVKVVATNTSVKKATHDTTVTFTITVPNFECAALPTLKPATNGYDVVMCGVVLDAGLVDCTPEDGWTVKVAGLPAGLKFDAKAVKITGVPTAKAGSYTVTFTASKKGEANQVATITLNVESLPAWVVGTFDGGLLSTAGVENDVLGLVQGLAVTANGKVSGKLINGDGTWTLAAASFDAYDQASGEYVATVIGKSGKLAFTNEVLVSAVDFYGSLRGQAEMTGDGVKAEAVQNLWKTAEWKAVAKGFAKAPALQVGEVTLKFAASGAVTAAGKFVTGYNEKTKKDIVYSASCSSVLIPQGGDDYVAYLYFPPKVDSKGNVTFIGYSATVRLVWDGAKFAQLPND